MKRICPALVLILSFATVQFGQTRSIVVSALENGLRETSEIRALRFASLEETKLIHLGDKFEVGDEIIGTGAVGIELRCPEGSLVKFSRKFRVVIVTPQLSRDCAINLLAGQADVITNRPTSVESGEITAGSRGTVYSLRAGRDTNGTNVACVVFDGEVDVVSRSAERSLLRVGAKKVWSPAGPTTLTLTADDIRQTATLYARLDVSKGQMAGAQITGATSTDLERAYLRVLQAPADAEARIELAAYQANLKVTSDAAYHLNRAEQLAPPSDRPQRARIAAVRSVAFAQAGDQRRATEQAALARTIDPDVVNSKDLAKYKIDTKRIQAAPLAPVPPGALRVTPEKSGAAPRGAAVVQPPRTAARATTVAESIPEAGALMEMISRGQYNEAIAGFQKRMQKFGQGARDAYGLAVAYSRLQRREEAVRYAALAMDLHEKLNQLSAAELKTCREIRASR